MGKLRIDQAVITKASMETMPEDVRAIFILAAHICNEIETLRRLALFSSRQRSPAAVVRVGTGRYFTLIRLLVGKTAEAFEAVRGSITGSQFWKDNRTDLSEAGTQALAKLNKLFGSSGLLMMIRNRHSFHYPRPDVIREGFARLEDNEDCSIYSGETYARHSTYFVGADTVMMWAMIHEIGEALKDKPENALKEMADQGLDASEALVTYLEELIIMIQHKHPDVLERTVEGVAVIQDAPLLEEFRIPVMTRNRKRPKNQT